MSTFRGSGPVILDYSFMFSVDRAIGI
ncbi:hypothetical protein U2A4042460002 [Corynebacterium striatum]|nr:hypothetical protein U2A4042460002 [Corynebacterium striatum]